MPRTHDQSEASALSSRVAIFNHGQLQQVAPSREVYERPANRFVAEFLGQINILLLGGVSARTSGTTATFEDQTLTMAASLGAPTTSFALRPEYMSLHTTAPKDGNAIRNAGATTELALKTPAAPPCPFRRPQPACPPACRLARKSGSVGPPTADFSFDDRIPALTGPTT